jgi:hypothetical protein
VHLALNATVSQLAGADITDATDPANNRCALKTATEAPKMAVGAFALSPMSTSTQTQKQIRGHF